MRRRNALGRGSAPRLSSGALGGRAWLAATIVFCLVVTVVGGLPQSVPPARAARPVNVVVIITDDQRAGTLRWMPTVWSELVGLGTSYTNAFVPTPTCCPSRASMFTGSFAPRTGVWANGGTVGGTPIGGWPAFAARGNEEKTVAMWLSPSHRTVLIGKVPERVPGRRSGIHPTGLG